MEINRTPAATLSYDPLLTTEEHIFTRHATMNAEGVTELSLIERLPAEVLDMIASYVILPATPVKTILAFAHTPEHLRASFCLCRQTPLEGNVVWVGGVGWYDPGPRRNGDIAVYYDLASQITSRRYGTEVQEAMVILRHISSDSRDYTPHAIKHRQDLRDFITNFEQKLLVPGDWSYRMENMLLLYYKLKEQFQYSIPSGGALRWSLEKMAIVGTNVAERLSDAVRMGISSSCDTGIATGLKESEQRKQVVAELRAMLAVCYGVQFPQGTLVDVGTSFVLCFLAAFMRARVMSNIMTA